MSSISSIFHRSSSSSQITAQTAGQSNDEFLSRLQSAKWHDVPKKLSKARTMYGGAVVQISTAEDSPVKDVIVVAGGMDCKNNVLSSVEVFDPSDYTVMPWHKLRKPRYGCGAFAVTTNAMCVLGGVMSEHTEDHCSKTVEMVTDRETILLPDQFYLPHQMAFFGTAKISEEVYIFGGKEGNGGTLNTIYKAELYHFVDATKGKYPQENVWKPVSSKAKFQKRQNFATVLTNNACWFIGGVAREKGAFKIVPSVGQYTGNLAKATYKDSGLALPSSLPRNGCTAFASEEYVVVLGGSLFSFASGLTNASSYDGIQANANAFLFFPNSNRPKPMYWNTQQIQMKDQNVFKINQKIYAIGQYDFTRNQPTSAIKFLNLDLSGHKQIISAVNDSVSSCVKTNYRPSKKHPTKHSTVEQANAKLGTSVYEYFTPDQSLINLNCNVSKRVGTQHDSEKINDVLMWYLWEPAEVSKEYGIICTNDYAQENFINKGTFGIVYRGTDKTLNRVFAFKRLANERNSMATIRTEKSTLTRFRHPNIVSLYGFHLDETSPLDSFLVYEYLEGGCLADYLKKKKGKDLAKFPYWRRLKIMSDVLCALKIFHKGVGGYIILHRDIKPHNICLTGDKTAKLIDFGLVRMKPTDSVDDGTSSDAPLAGTPLYRCKTYQAQLCSYRPACDMYSFGIVMIELLTGKLIGSLLDGKNKEFYKDLLGLSSTPNEAGVATLFEDFDDEIPWGQDEDEKRLCERALLCLSTHTVDRPTAGVLFDEIGKMLLRVPNDESLPDFDTDFTARGACSVCYNEGKLITCRSESKKHWCAQCITKMARDETNVVRGEVQCPICGYIFRKNNLFSVVPVDVYDSFNREEQLRDIRKDLQSVKRDVKQMVKAIPALTEMITIIGNYRCPKLVLIIPQDSNRLMIQMASTSWIRKEYVKVYFICEWSYQPVSVPVLLRISPKLLGRIAPALKLTVKILRNVIGIMKLLWPIFPHVNAVADPLTAITNFVDSLLTDPIFKADAFCTDTMNPSDFNQVKHLTDEAYNILADNICKERQFEWRKELSPVVDQKNIIKWVKKEYAAEEMRSGGVSHIVSNASRSAGNSD